MGRPPQVISSVGRFTGRVFRVRTDELAFDDGATASVDIVEHRGSYAIVALTADDRIVLVRQYRHAVGRELWELPAGTAEPGESAIEGALRELAEETGYRATSARSLGAFYMTPGFCTEMLHFVHATGLEAGEQALDEDERITVQNFTLPQAEALLAAGEIADAKTVLALAWMRGLRGELAATSADN